jgi:hypothetical protein
MLVMESRYIPQCLQHVLNLSSYDTLGECSPKCIEGLVLERLSAIMYIELRIRIITMCKWKH